MMTILGFTVPGRPQPCQRARVVTDARGRTRPYTEDRTVEFEARVALFAGSAARISGWSHHPRDTYALTLWIFRADERHWAGKNSGDWDNFGKAVSDGLNGVVYHDDRGVTDCTVRVRCDPKNPRVEVELEKLTDGRLYQEPKRTRKKPARRTPKLALGSKVDGARTVRGPKPPPLGG